MSWVRLDDNFLDHPKMVGLRLELVGLWAKGLGYCGRHLTDGALRRALLPHLSGLPLSKATRLAEELVKAGLWENAGVDYLVHDYLAWNPSRREVLEERERRSLAGRTAARSRWQRPPDPRSDAVCEPHAARIDIVDANRIEIAAEAPCTRPDPSRPDPSRPKEVMAEATPSADPPGRPLGAAPAPVEGSTRRNGHELDNSRPTAATWEAYAVAYERRYGAPPPRNASINGRLANFVRRVPVAAAPAIAAHYVASNDPGYSRNGHPVSLLLRDAEKLHTEWVTGQRIGAGPMLTKTSGNRDALERFVARGVESGR
jgi:hypothetical protein